MGVKKYNITVDLQQNQLHNAVIHNLLAPPGTLEAPPVEGQLYYNASKTAAGKKLYLWAEEWVDLTNTMAAGLQDVVNVDKTADRIELKKTFYSKGSFFPEDSFYFVDTEVSDGSFYVYGGFDGYQGVPAFQIVKIKNTGELDTSFTPPGSINNDPYDSFEIFERADGRLLVGGWFTEINGLSRSSLALLNPDGSVSVDFNIGSGFDDYTTSIRETYNQKLYITGRYSWYNGTYAKSLVRLNSDGTLDGSLVTGSGFNNTTLFTLPNADGSLFVTGYFSEYNGLPANRIIKLLENGSPDTSFDVGAGFNASGLVVLRMLELSNGSLLVSGASNNSGTNFSTYNGASVGNIVALLPSGEIDTSFQSGTGFDGDVSAMELDSKGKIIITGLAGTYNGTPLTSGAVVLNQDGSIFKMPDSLFPGEVFQRIFENSDGKYVGITNSFNLLNEDFIPQNDKTLSFDEVTGRAEYNIETYEAAGDYELLNKKVIKKMMDSYVSALMAVEEITDYNYSINGDRNEATPMMYLSREYIPGTLKVYLNGLRLTRGNYYDYREGTSNILVMNYPLEEGDLLTADYKSKTINTI